MRLIDMLTILALLFLSSCAALDSNIRIDGDLLLSDRPRLSIKLKKEVVQIDDSRETKKIVFTEENTSPLFFRFSSRSGPLHKLDYYYSLPHIASNHNFYYMGPVYFGDNEWAKISRVDDEGILVYGYFTLKGDDFIFVYMAYKLNDKGIKIFKPYKETLKMPDEAISVLSGMFEEFHRFVEIQY